MEGEVSAVLLMKLR